MRKLAALLTCLLLLCAACAPAGTETSPGSWAKTDSLTVLVCPDLPPMAYYGADGALAGAEIRLAETLAEALGLPLTLKPVAFDGLFDALAAGEGTLAVAALGATDARTAGFLLSNPYNLTGEDAEVLLMRAEDAPHCESAADFSGKTVLAQAASVQEQLLFTQLPGAIPGTVKTPAEGADAVQTGDADAFAVSGGAAEALLQSYPALAAAAFRLEGVPGGNVIAVRVGETALLASVNEVLARVNAEGRFETWLDEAAADAGH